MTTMPAPGLRLDESSQQLLQRATEEAARLLNADGAMVYLVDEDGERLLFAIDAGIRDPEARTLIRDLSLPVGVGLFGTAVARGEVAVTGDYRKDRRFTHAKVADRIVMVANMRSMAAAPLIAEGKVLGAMGAYTSRIDDFDEARIGLLRALADHAATAIANARLIDRLERSEAELARRVEAQRTLGEITARIAAIHDPEALLQLVVDAAKRLLQTDGAHLTLLEPRGRFLRPTVMAGDTDPEGRAWLAEQEFPIGGGINGLAARDREIVCTEDYLADPRIPHAPYDHQVADRMGLRGMAAAPMRAPDGGIVGTLAVSFGQPHQFSDDELELLQGLADQAAIAISNAQLTERLRASGEAQRTLAEIAAQIASIRDPAVVLQRAVDEGVRLLGADGGRIDLLDSAGELNWAYGHAEIDRPIQPEPGESFPGEGVSGQAVLQRSVIFTGDYLSDTSFPHAPHSDRYVAEHGIRSVMAAPLIGEAGAFGTLTVHAREPDAFAYDDAELLEALADQAAIAVTNARLYDELRTRVDAQRVVAAISAEIASLRNPETVIQRAVSEAARLLDADRAQINLVADEGDHLDPPVASAPNPPSASDVAVPIGSGIAGVAAAEQRVCWTGDYLADRSFTHDPGDERIREQGIRSMMSAPLIGPGGLLGTITVQSKRPDLFDEEDGALLRLLADQAAIAMTNARLHEQHERQIDSQRRLLEITERLLSSLSPDDVLDAIADGLKRVVRYDNLGIYRLDTDADLLQPVLARDRNAPQVLDFAIPRGKGLTWWAVEHREPILINDALADPRAVTIPGTPEEEEALVIVPLVARDEVVGVMNIGRLGGPEVAFNEAEFETVQLFAGQAAIAMVNAHLYEQLLARIDAQRTLTEIAARITALHDPSDILQRTASEAARLLGAESSDISILEHEDEPMVWAFGHGEAGIPADDADRKVAVRAGEGLSGKAVAERRVVTTGDYLTDSSFVHVAASDAFVERHGIRSAMAAPLLGESRVLGTLSVFSPRLNAFDADDAELLGAIASQAAVAVTNARLYDELQRSEVRYRFLVESSPDVIWETDAEGRFIFLSESLERQTGFRAEAFIGRSYVDLTDPGSVATAAQALDRLREHPDQPQSIRIDLPHASGGTVPVEITMMARVADGRFVGAHGSGRDVGERERLERDLRRQAAELAASQERAHLARELHDSVTQALFSMGLTARSLELLLDSNPEGARGKLAELRELQRDALAEMRTLIFELRPHGLQQDGLVQALRNQAAAVEGRTGLSVTVEADEELERLPLEAEEALYRIGQEALHNVVKHAGANWARIRLRMADGHVELRVQDDGSGFDPDHVPRGHLGLTGMRQRIERFSGELHIESRAGSGTTVRAALPIPGAPPPHRPNDVEHFG